MCLLLIKHLSLSIICLKISWEDFQIVFHFCCFVFLTLICVECYFVLVYFFVALGRLSDCVSLLLFCFLNVDLRWMLLCLDVFLCGFRLPCICKKVSFDFLLFNSFMTEAVMTEAVICSANQWTGFYIITATVMKELMAKISNAILFTKKIVMRAGDDQRVINYEWPKV